MEVTGGFEPPTVRFRDDCSTTELCDHERLDKNGGESPARFPGSTTRPADQTMGEILSHLPGNKPGF